MKRIFLLCLFLVAPLSSYAQGFAADPCLNPQSVKSSVVVNITTATTTQLVAAGGAQQAVYVCSFSMTVSQVITTANILRFVQGTGTNCATGQTDLTGPFGTGGVTAAPPIVILGNAGTLFKTGLGAALCAVTTIGASAAFSGFVSYVQQ